MSLHRYTSFSNALVALEKAGDAAQLISFDIFDTLLFRKAHPDGVLGGVAAWLNAQQLEGQPPAQDARRAYHDVFQTLSQQNVNQGLDREVFSTELFKKWVATLFPTAAPESLEIQVKNLEDTYLAFESWACYPNPEIKDILEKLKARNIPLIFVSDMYLPRRVIDGLLENMGLLAYFSRGYVSGEYGLLKKSSRLFQHVLIKENIFPSNLIHFGDSAEADGFGAAQLGIHAILCEDTVRLNARGQLGFDVEAFRKDHNWGGLRAATAAAITMHETKNMSALESYAYHRLGPVFAAFIHDLVERTTAGTTNHVPFLTQEEAIHKELRTLFASTLSPTAPLTPAHSAKDLNPRPLISLLKEKVPTDKMGSLQTSILSYIKEYMLAAQILDLKARDTRAYALEALNYAHHHLRRNDNASIAVSKPLSLPQILFLRIALFKTGHPSTHKNGLSLRLYAKRLWIGFKAPQRSLWAYYKKKLSQNLFLISSGR